MYIKYETHADLICPNPQPEYPREGYNFLIKKKVKAPAQVTH